MTTYTKKRVRLPRNLLQVSRAAPMISMLLRTLKAAVKDPRRSPGNVPGESCDRSWRDRNRSPQSEFLAEPEPADGAPDEMARLIWALDENARKNAACLEQGLQAWRRRGSAPAHLAFRCEVADMIDPEALGTLISFAHPADVPVIFEALVELRDDPLSVRLVAETLARQYLERGFEHIGCRIADVPLWQEPEAGDTIVR